MLETRWPVTGNEVKVAVSHPPAQGRVSGPILILGLLGGLILGLMKFGGKAFIHRLLLEHFAAMKPEDIKAIVGEK